MKDIKSVNKIYANKAIWVLRIEKQTLIVDCAIWDNKKEKCALRDNKREKGVWDVTGSKVRLIEPRNPLIILGSSN